MADKESIGAKVDPDVKQRVRVAAAKRGMSMSEYIRQAVLDQLEDDEGNSSTTNPATAD
jgi:antitoxin component of RelBE/YafQ-DinJ toxin-antitoxin module